MCRNKQKGDVHMNDFNYPAISCRSCKKMKSNPDRCMGTGKPLSQDIIDKPEPCKLATEKHTGSEPISINGVCEYYNVDGESRCNVLNEVIKCRDGNKNCSIYYKHKLNIACETIDDMWYERVGIMHSVNKWFDDITEWNEEEGD